MEMALDTPDVCTDLRGPWNITAVLTDTPTPGQFLSGYFKIYKGLSPWERRVLPAQTHSEGQGRMLGSGRLSRAQKKAPPAPGCFRTTTAQLLPSGRWQEAVGTARCSTRLAQRILSSAVLPVLDSRAFHEPSFTPPPAQLSLSVATALQDPLLSARALHPTAARRKLDRLGRERAQKSREGRSEPWRGLFLVITYREPVSLNIWSCSGLESSVTPLRGHLKPHPGHCDLELALPPQA